MKMGERGSGRACTVLGCSRLALERGSVCSYHAVHDPVGHVTEVTTGQLQGPAVQAEAFEDMDDFFAAKDLHLSLTDDGNSQLPGAPSPVPITFAHIVSLHFLDFDALASIIESAERRLSYMNSIEVRRCFARQRGVFVCFPPVFFAIQGHSADVDTVTPLDNAHRPQKAQRAHASIVVHSRLQCFSRFVFSFAASSPARVPFLIVSTALPGVRGFRCRAAERASESFV